MTKEILEQSAYCTTGQYSTNCAIACAVRCLLPNSTVTGPHIKVYSKDYKYISAIKLPLEAVLFIKEFDDCMPLERKKMVPTSFEIDVPDSVIESIGISEAERTISNNLTMEKV